MTEVMRDMLRVRRFPNVWKKGVLKVFLKSEEKSKTKVKSYRPVTLLPVLGKVCERVLVERLVDHLDWGRDCKRGSMDLGRGRALSRPY